MSKSKEIKFVDESEIGGSTIVGWDIKYLLFYVEFGHTGLGDFTKEKTEEFLHKLSSVRGYTRPVMLTTNREWIGEILYRLFKIEDKLKEQWDKVIGDDDFPSHQMEAGPNQELRDSIDVIFNSGYALDRPEALRVIESIKDDYGLELELTR